MVQRFGVVRYPPPLSWNICVIGQNNLRYLHLLKWIYILLKVYLACIWIVQTKKNCFRYLRLMSPLNAAICTTISYTLWVEWYYLKNNYLTLRSKVKVPRWSLRYATHHLMVMHPHTKYHGPISKDKNVMALTIKYYLKNNYLTLRSKVKVPHEGHYGMRHTALWSCTHIPNIIDLSGKTKKLWSGQASLRRSRRSGSGRKNQTKTICLPSFEGET